MVRLTAIGGERRRRVSQRWGFPATRRRTLPSATAPAAIAASPSASDDPVEGSDPEIGLTATVVLVVMAWVPGVPPTAVVGVADSTCVVVMAPLSLPTSDGGMTSSVVLVTSGTVVDVVVSGAPVVDVVVDVVVGSVVDVVVVDVEVLVVEVLVVEVLVVGATVVEVDVVGASVVVVVGYVGG